MPSGASSTYFNPSLLVLQPPAIQFGVVVLSQDLDIALEPRPEGIDITDSIYGARQLNPDGSSSRLVYRPLPTDLLRTPRGSHDSSQLSLYGEFGVITHLVPDRLVLGAYTVIPAEVFQGQNPFYVDEREQYFSNSLGFELYEDRSRLSLMGAALAGKPLDWLTLGVGLMLNTTSVAVSDIYVIDPSDQGVANINGHVEITTSLVPHFGLAVEPLTGLRLSGTVHLRQANDVTGKGDLQFWDYDYPQGQHSVEQPFGFTHAYNPLRVGLGASYEGGADRRTPVENRSDEPDERGRGSGEWAEELEEGQDQGAPPGRASNGDPPRSGSVHWLVAASVLWADWSDYRDRHQERPFRTWSDTFSAVVAGEISFSAHRLGLDLTWVPTPVPDQTGRSNYVDNTRLGGSVGWDWQVSLGGKSFLLSAQLQVQRLLHRSVAKRLDVADPVFDEFPDSIDIRTDQVIPDSLGFQTNNPGYPGFASQGWIVSGGVSMSYQF
ncbi:MAG: hypothetical protein JW797_19990 [Bradymonadales bacterium]|nr:hypothetical protein [Bradymonadales bacterium]